MKRSFFFRAVIFVGVFFAFSHVSAQSSDLRVVLIRHAEKPKKGDDLSCKGVNRSIQLVPVLHSRFGVPAAIYAPVASGKGKHSRMQQTVAPFATKYHVAINTDFTVNEVKELAKTVRQQKGTIFIVWEHNGLSDITRRLGVKGVSLDWPDEDYDSMWIVSYVNGVASLKKDKEGLHPTKDCP